MSRAIRLLFLVALSGLAGCSALDKPVRPSLYDFGPGATAAPAVPAAPLSPLVLAEIEVTGAFDGTAVLYRLGYADANQLRPYGQARWSAQPAQLVRLRVRDQLSRTRVVLDPSDSGVLARTGGSAPRVLRLDLEEFSHLFEAPDRSSGLVRLRATLMDNTPAGEKLLGQRSIVVQRPAATQDAPGGVRALAAAVDAAAGELSQWLAQYK